MGKERVKIRLHKKEKGREDIKSSLQIKIEWLEWLDLSREKNERNIIFSIFEHKVIGSIKSSHPDWEEGKKNGSTIFSKKYKCYYVGNCVTPVYGGPLFMAILRFLSSIFELLCHTNI